MTCAATPASFAGWRKKLRLSDGPTAQVLTGHRGSGKSTELTRLRRELETSSDAQQPFFVVQVRANDELDRNDIDFPEVLIAIARQIATQLRERAGIKLKPDYFKDRLKRLKDLALTELSFDEVSLEAGMASGAATIKNSPEARDSVRKALEPDTNN